MIDNTDIIEQTGALERLSDADRAMLAKCGRRLGSTLCRVLRHSPEIIGVSMDKQGWVNVRELIEKYNISNHGKKCICPCRCLWKWSVRIISRDMD